MNTKAIVGIFVGTVLLIGGLVWFGQPSGGQNNVTTSNEPNSVLKTEESSYDFGTVSMANGNVSRIFKVRNIGPETVMMDKLYTSCMCTSASLMMDGQKFGPFGMPGHGAAPSIKANLAPGQEAEIEVVFDPTAHGPAGVGKIERVVILENSAGSPVEFNFSANVTP